MADDDYLVPFTTLPDGRLASVVALTFGRGRVCVGTDRESYADGY